MSQSKIDCVFKQFSYAMIYYYIDLIHVCLKNIDLKISWVSGDVWLGYTTFMSVKHTNEYLKDMT